jgi:hypothetical protein
LRWNAVDCGERSAALAFRAIVKPVGSEAHEDTVNEPAPPSVTSLPSEGSADRLDSWKNIAVYLKRDVSTVQRWERREGMPVHRHLHDKLGSVYAFRSELDVWSQSRNVLREDDAETTPPVGLESLTDGRPEPLRGLTFDDRSTGARTEPDPAARASIRSRRASRRPFVWLTIGAGVVLAVGIAVWLLERADYFWQNPLADAQFRRVTDFEGTEQAAAISRDGKYVAFLSDRDGRMDAWVTQVGTGQFYNLTRGSIPELVNPSVRTTGFSPDGALVLFWARKPDGSKVGDIGIWAVPTLGGQPRPISTVWRSWTGRPTAPASSTIRPGLATRCS